jgi:hypothetical protein
MTTEPDIPTLLARAMVEHRAAQHVHWPLSSVIPEAQRILATPSGKRIAALGAVAEIMRRHTHDGRWAMSQYAGPDTNEDCHLCRALVDAGFLTLDGIGAGTRASILDEASR